MCILYYDSFLLKINLDVFNYITLSLTMLLIATTYGKNVYLNVVIILSEDI